MERARLLLLCLCVCCARAQDCQPVSDDHCRCLFSDNSFIDISALFTYPVIFKTIVEYSYSPCKSLQCGTDASNVALCMHNQTSGAHTGLGKFKGGPDWFITSMDPLNFTISYIHGDVIFNKTSFSIVTFVYENTKSMAFSFVDSRIYDKFSVGYNFLVTGPGIVVTKYNSGGESVNPGLLAGSIVGSWFGLVILTAVTVTLIISCVVKNDRKKRAGYQPLADQQPENAVNQQPENTIQ